MPLSVMFQLFTDTSAIGMGVQEDHVCCHFQYFLVINAHVL
jgi:hypothetical protein